MNIKLASPAAGLPRGVWRPLSSLWPPRPSSRPGAFSAPPSRPDEACDMPRPDEACDMPCPALQRHENERGRKERSAAGSPLGLTQATQSQGFPKLHAPRPPRCLSSSAPLARAPALRLRPAAHPPPLRNVNPGRGGRGATSAPAPPDMRSTAPARPLCAQRPLSAACGTRDPQHVIVARFPLP